MSPHLNYYEVPSFIYKNCYFSNGDTNIWLTYSNCILLNQTEGSSVDASGVYANELQSILKVIICWTFIVLFHILKFKKKISSIEITWGVHLIKRWWLITSSLFPQTRSVGRRIQQNIILQFSTRMKKVSKSSIVT